MGPHALIVAPASARTPLLRLFAARTRIALASNPRRGTPYVRRPSRSTRRLLGRRPYSKRLPMQPEPAESARLKPVKPSISQFVHPGVAALVAYFFWLFCLRRSSC
jgi:hypothetical protein